MRKVHWIGGVKWFKQFACGEKFRAGGFALWPKSVTCKKCLKKMGG